MIAKLMRFDPATGEERPYPSHAAQWREWHGGMAWLFNPWTGSRRHASDVGSDPYGLLIVPDGDPLRPIVPVWNGAKKWNDLLSAQAAPEPATAEVDAGALEALEKALDALSGIHALMSSDEMAARHERVIEAALRLLAGGE